jgi:hypothetical protein
MAIIVSENFDSVTPPAVPSSVTFVPEVNNTGATSSSFGLSSPNSFAVTASSGTCQGTIYSTVSCPGNISCIVSGAFYYPTSAATFHVVCRIVYGARSLWVQAGEFSYDMMFSSAGNVRIIRISNGVATDITNIALSGYFTADAWYIITFIKQSLSFSGYLQRASDGLWLNPSAVYQAARVPVVTGTDTSPVDTRDCYGGIFTQNTTVLTTYMDNFYFSVTGPSPTRRRRR